MGKEDSALEMSRWNGPKLKYLKRAPFGFNLHSLDGVALGEHRVSKLFLETQNNLKNSSKSSALALFPIQLL